MKSYKLITSALMALGLVSAAHASGTFGSTNVVYITGSTAFRPNLFAAITQNATAPSLFDVGTPVSSYVAGGGAANNGSSVYNAVGKIGGNFYCISVSLTGSEAGLASLEGSTITYKVPKISPAMTNAPTVNNTTVTLAGTPKPTFIDPGTQAATVVVQPDLSLADTSQAVSLSAALTPLKDYGIVGVIPFDWAKGVNNTPDGSWSDLVNVTEPQLATYLYNQDGANVFTGNAADTDIVYLIGRNEGSGTRVNTLCDLVASITRGVTQYALNISFYGGGGNVLTAPPNPAAMTSSSLALNLTGVHLVSVGNDGFDSGSGVKTTLNSDINGQGIVTIGYIGLGDAVGLTHATKATTSGNGQLLSLAGVDESDASVLNGTYSFWGHEHFYGLNSPVEAASCLGGWQSLAGTTVNSQLLNFSANGAFEKNGNLSSGGGPLGNSTCIDAALMTCDKPSGGDVGYPAPF